MTQGQAGFILWGLRMSEKNISERGPEYTLLAFTSKRCMLQLSKQPGLESDLSLQESLLALHDEVLNLRLWGEVASSSQTPHITAEGWRAPVHHSRWLVPSQLARGLS